MAETKKTYTIPLRKSFQEAAPLKRGPKAVRAIKAYLYKHCKVEVVKLGAKLNTAVWAKGITRPPHKVTVDVTVADGVAKAELAGFTYVEAKKVEKKKEPQTFKEKLAEKIGGAKTDSDAKEATPAAAEEQKTVEKPAEKKDAPKPAPATKDAKPAEKTAEKPAKA